jgi:hypothetical protein
MALNTASTGARQAYVANNIIWQNHTLTPARQGIGIVSQTANKLVLNNNMFSGNGASDTNASGAALNIGNGFDPGLLGPLAANAAANLGNFTGYPAFVAPRDPRPGSDGPATFLRDANFGLTSSSAAINNALGSVAPATDFLGNAANRNPTNRGFGLPGYGPRDVGAFEFIPLGTAGTQAVGGSFRVVTTSLVPDSGTVANGATLYVSPVPNSVIVSFSRPVDRASLQATDLVLSGTVINPLSPVRATSLTWLDDHTVKFNLSGQFNSQGTVNVSVSAGSVQSVGGQAVAGYSDKVLLDAVNAPPAPTTGPSPVPITPAPAPAPTPAPAPAPAPTTPTRPIRRPVRRPRVPAPPRNRIPARPLANRPPAQTAAPRPVARPLAPKAVVATPLAQTAALPTRRPFTFPGKKA